MIENENHKRCKKRKKTQILSALKGIPESGSSVEAELLFGMVFIHTWNTKARLKRRSKISCWFMVRNQLLKILWSCATEAVVHEWKNLVVDAILQKKPEEGLRDSLGVFFSSLSVSQSLLLCSAQDGAVSDLAAPTYSYCSNPTSIIPMRLRLTCTQFCRVELYREKKRTRPSTVPCGTRHVRWVPSEDAIFT